MKIKYSPSTQHKIEPRLYKLLINIHDNLLPPEDLESLTNLQFIDYMVGEIRSVSDMLHTSIIRVDKSFYIFDRTERLDLPKKSLETFLIWVAKRMNMPESVVYDELFIDEMFGACWRRFKQ